MMTALGTGLRLRHSATIASAMALRRRLASSKSGLVIAAAARDRARVSAEKQNGLFLRSSQT
jgi:hypothetical protein